MSNQKIVLKETPNSHDVVYFDSSVIAFNNTSHKNLGTDIVFENISYSVEVLD